MLNIPAQISQITDHCWSLQNMLIFFMKSWLEYKMHILLFCMMLSCDTVVNYLVVDSVGIQSMILSQPLANDNVYVFVWKLFTINCFMIILNCFTPNIFTTSTLLIVTLQAVMGLSINYCRVNTTKYLQILLTDADQ